MLALGIGAIKSGVMSDCPNAISIGNGAAISEGITICDSASHPIDQNTSLSDPIVIQDHVWIGLNSTILKGVRIRSGSVVAARVVVTRDVLDNTLVGGVPIRVLKDGAAWM